MSKVRKKRTRFKKTDRVWQLQEAKARFSELVTEVERDGYQTITKNGHPVAVIISKKEFEKMQSSGNSLLDFFRQSPFPELDLDIKRNKDIGRDIEL